MKIIDVNKTKSIEKLHRVGVRNVSSHVHCIILNETLLNASKKPKYPDSARFLQA